ncbi:MAG TPA: ATP-binding protein [Nitriliruptorales bacterium]
MDAPARLVVDNLLWSTDGSVWAVWSLQSVTYAYLSAREKLRLHGRLRAALTSLPAEAMLLSVCRRRAVEEVAERMLADVDAGAAPGWAPLVERSLAHLDGRVLYERHLFLACALPSDGARADLTAALRTAAARLGMQAGLSPPGVLAAELARRRRQAADLAARLGGGIALRPASADELVSLFARAAYRGLDVPEAEASLGAAEASRRSPAGTAGTVRLADAVFKEGGLPDDPGRPTHRRYLRVETAAGVSFQTFLVVADLPRTWAFPGGAGEWFAAVASLPCPIDWCARIEVVSNQEAQHKTRRQARQLTAQVAEYDGEPAGPPPSLQEAQDALDEQRAELAAATAVPELQTTIVFSLASDDLAELEQQAEHVAAIYQSYEYLLPRPTGGQRQLFRAMLPGSATPQVCRDYVQWLLPRDLASAMPLGGTELGDPTGALLGLSLDAGTDQPVLFDPAYGPSMNRSGSIGAFGALGSGKSYLVKRLAHALLARGGRVVALDRTAVGEYAAFARAAPGRTQVVEISQDAPVSIDPLRTFAPDARVRYAVGFLTLLTGTSPTDLDGATLAQAVRQVAAREGRLRDVITELQALADTRPEADTLARKLDHFADDGLARLAFGDGETLALDADCVVLWAPGLSLPDRDQLDRDAATRQLLPEQVFSLACLYLIAAVAREITFRDRDRFAAAVFDEAWSLTASPQGRQLLLEGIRDGRKHNAAVWLLSQHPDDVGDPRLVELLGSRFVFRQSHGAASRALAFLGMDASEESVDLVETGLGTGECLYRDVRDRVGRVHVLPASDPELERAWNTTPPTRASVVNGGGR